MSLSTSELSQRLGEVQKLKSSGQAALALELMGPDQDAYNRIPGYFHLKGTLLQDLQKDDEAIAAYRKELLYRPKFVESHINLGVIYFRLRRFNEAIASFKVAVLLAPGGYLGFFNLGNVMRALGRYKEALVYFRRALAIDPTSLDVLINMSPVLRQLKMFDEAQAVYREILHRDPTNENASHMLAALKGEATERAPQGYVTKLFDQYAEHFDESLVNELAYETPQKMAKILASLNLVPQTGLDLGCGTGLGVAGLTTIWPQTTWTGVDLSQNMLAAATKKGLYQSCRQADIMAFLAVETTTYDAVLCLDTLPYLGHLGAFFKGVAAVTAAHSVIALSSETRDGIEDFGLTTSGRYYHSPDYMIATAGLFGLTTIACEATTIRTNEGAPVRGHLLVLQPGRPAT